MIEWTTEEQALLEGAGIPTQQPKPSEQVTEWQEAKEAWNKQVWNFRTYSLNSARDYFGTTKLTEQLQENTERIAEMEQSLATIKEGQDHLLELMAKGAEEAERDYWQSLDDFAKVIRDHLAKEQEDYSAKYGTLEERYGRAMKAIKSAGIIVKGNSRNVWQLADGVPVMWAMERPQPIRGDVGPSTQGHYQRNLANSEGEATPAGEKVLRAFDREGIRATFQKGRHDSYLKLDFRASTATYRNPLLGTIADKLGRW